MRITFVQETGEFVCNMATFDLRDAMNATLGPPLPRGEMGEFDHRRSDQGGAPRLVRPPRWPESPVALECKPHSARSAAANRWKARRGYSYWRSGQVIGIHIDRRLHP